MLKLPNSSKNIFLGISSLKIQTLLGLNGNIAGLAASFSVVKARFWRRETPQTLPVNTCWGGR
jgi:hypothetical protein